MRVYLQPRWLPASLSTSHPSIILFCWTRINIIIWKNLHVFMMYIHDVHKFRTKMSTKTSYNVKILSHLFCANLRGLLNVQQSFTKKQLNPSDQQCKLSSLSLSVLFIHIKVYIIYLFERILPNVLVFLIVVAKIKAKIKTKTRRPLITNWYNNKFTDFNFCFHNCVFLKKCKKTTRKNTNNKQKIAEAK